MRTRSLLHLPWLLLACTFASATPARAQHDNAVLPGPGWQVLKAEWGAGNRWMDVTYQVRTLLSGNGMVRVNNQNMGGDPAVGADKILRIRARNSQGQSRQFNFKEGSSIDADQFYNYYGGSGGEGGGLLVMWADWGIGNRRMDVTNQVRALLSGNGLVRVNNQNMGGDPAVGADKVLRISARDMQGQVQQFSYKEGSSIDAGQFYNYGAGGGGHHGHPEYSDRPGYPGGDRDDRGELQIVRAFYGLNNRTNDVTQLMRSMVRGGTLVVQVNNNNMGGDPAVGADKVLTVIYRYQGREQSATVKEGNMLRIP